MNSQCTTVINKWHKNKLLVKVEKWISQYEELFDDDPVTHFDHVNPRLLWK